MAAVEIGVKVVFIVNVILQPSLFIHAPSLCRDPKLDKTFFFSSFVVIISLVLDIASVALAFGFGPQGWLVPTAGLDIALLIAFQVPHAMVPAV